MRKTVCLFMLALFAAAGVFGQAAGGFGGISGVVRDASGASVPNAEVRIENAAKGVHRSVKTNDAGLFSAPALVPAPGYTVSVSVSGFAPYETKDVQIQVGQTVNLDIALALATSSTQVQVTAEAAVVDDTKMSVSQVIGTKEIMDLPINGRRVDSFVLLTPGVTNDGTFGLLTFRGIAGGNSFLVDGADTTEQFYNENAGRTRISSQVSLDAVQEFQVLSATFSAEYGRASGGVVNTVTRSGSNALHGTMYWFFRNRTLDARDRYASINPHEVRHQAGFSIGGPVKKDKLFYFVNFDITRRDFPMVSSINRPTVVDPNTQTFLGCGAPATPAQCSAINSILPRYFGLIPRSGNQELGLAKLDWRPTPKNSFSASMNYLHWLSPNGIQTSVASTSGSAIGSNGDDVVRVRNASVNWTYVPTASIVNQFRFGWFSDLQYDKFDQGLLPQGIGLITLTVNGQSGLGAGANYLPRTEPNERRFQFADSLAWIKGRHAMKFGFDIANTDDYTYFISNAFGAYTYQTVTNFALDFSGNTAGGKHWQSFAQTFGNPVVHAAIQDNGFYAEDQFRIRRNLTLTYGVRYEYAALPQPKLFNPDYPQTAHIPSSRGNFAPRVSLAYAFNNDKTVLRASYGMFHARFPASLIDNLFTNNGVLQQSLSLQATDATQLAIGPVYPNAIPTAPASAKGSSSIQFLAPGLKTPYSEQGTFAVERKLPANMDLTVSYIWSRGLQLLTVRDLNIGAPTGTGTYIINDAGGNAVGAYTTPVYLSSAVIDKRYQHVYQNENGMNSYYNALAVQLQKPLSHGLYMDLAYTWAHSIDYGQGGGGDALFFSNTNSVTFNGNYKFDKGSARLDQRHRFVMNFIESPTFTHRDGAFYKYVVNNWQLSGTMTLASGRPNTASISLQDTPVPGMWFNNTLNGFGGNFRVPFWPVNSIYTPPTYRGDARISKIIPFNERYKLYLNFEVFNVSNTIVDTSVFTQAYTEKNHILTPTPGLGNGSGSFGFPDGTNARRAQVGARFVF